MRQRDGASRDGGVGARLSGAIDAARSSPWAPVLGRVVAIASALVVLACIGRVASAGAAASSGGRGAALADGGLVSTPEARGDAPPAWLAGAMAGATPAPSPEGRPATAPCPAVGDGSSPPARATPGAPVHLNTADESELRRLPGVGPKRAQAILALRARLGRFRRVEELLRVKGVGRGVLRKWRPLVTLEPPPTAPHEVDAGAA